MKTQEIVTLYFKREINKTLNKFKNKEEEILNLDKLYSVLNEKLKDINLLLSENGYYEIDLNLKNYIYNKTDRLLGKLNMEVLEEQENIFNERDELTVMLSACNTYEQEIEVLIAYGIVDKNGKISAW